MRLSLIAALARNRVIGKDNRLPWSLPEDLKRFKAITSGHPVIMGRRTYDSIGRPLPGRANIVVSRKVDLRIPNITVVPSLEAALEHCRLVEEAFVIGGAEIYRIALPLASRLYLTQIHQDFEGDALFPDFSRDDFREVAREDRFEPLPFSFVVLERIG